MPEAPSPFTACAGGVRVTLKVTPRAARSAVTGIEVDARGEPYLAVRLTAAPEAGKANTALIRLLARRWGVAASDLHLVRGERARRKVIELEGPADPLLARLVAIERPGAD